jgi:hypothetical protein
MTFREYLAEPSRASERGTPATVESFKARLQIPTSASEIVSAMLGQRLRAKLNVAPARGQFPLVLFETGMNAPAYLYIHLAEELASRGYAVVAIPSFGIPPDSLLPFDTRGIAVKASDLESALYAAKRLSFVDSTRVALAAWSVGGVSMGIVADRHPEIRALLSLDSALGYLYGAALFDSLSPAGTFSIPLLHLTGSRNQGVAKADWFFQRLTASPGFKAVIRDMSHAQFTSILQGGILAEELGDSLDRAVVAPGTRAMNELSRWFLDRFLKNPAPTTAYRCDRSPLRAAVAHLVTFTCNSEALREARGGA